MGSKDPYRSYAGVYDRLFEPMNRGLRLLGLRMFQPRRGMAVLDIGCGTGAHLDVYRRFDCHLHGIDSSPSMLEVARRRLGDGADLRLGDASAMPYQDDSFDLITCMLTLHEMDHSTRLAVIREMQRALKEGGRILLIDFQPGPIRSFKALLTKSVIFVSEVAAGRKHFENFRHFMTIKGLPTLIRENDLKVEEEKTVSGGALALFLLSSS